VAWSQALEDAAWRRIDVRDGSKGPLVVEAVKRRVVSRTHRRQQGDEELLTVLRYRDRDQDEVVKVDYYLSNTVPETALEELARVAKAEHRIEECLQRSKSEAGLADYEVRNWTGWQQHQTLSLLAPWFLERETQRGKKMDTGHDVTADTPGHRDDRTRGVSVWDDGAYVGGKAEALAT
jgi:SRSO17 transposase